jgi:hypothetical protein
MRAKAIITALLMAALVLGAGTAARARAGIEDRQTRQRGLIYEGMRSGEITEEEFSRLDREQYGIETQRRRAVSDGYLSREEEGRLHRSLKRARGHIREARRNRRPPHQHFRWRWHPRYDRYHHHYYWRHYYDYGYHHWRHYRPRHKHYRRRPPHYRPGGYINFGIRFD